MSAIPLKTLEEVIVDVESLLKTAKDNLNTIENSRKSLKGLKELSPDIIFDLKNLDELKDAVRDGLLQNLKAIR